MIEVPITDTFDEPQGRFRNYTAYDVDSAAQLAAQKHIDIRNGYAEAWTPTYRGLVLGNNPSLYWRLDETVGTNAEDETANNRDGTLVGSVVFNGEALGADSAHSAVFSGGRITSAYNALTGDRTFAGLAQVNDLLAADGVFGGANDNAGMTFEPQSGGWQFRPNGAVGPQSWGISGVVANVAFHWALTWNNTTRVAELFINGVSQGTKTYASAWDASPGNFHLGRGNVSGTNRTWAGLMDEFAIYPTILSPTHIKALYRKGIGQEYSPINPASVATMQAWFKPESLNQLGADADIPQWNDSSSNNRHATEATNRPINRLNQVRGYRAADFDGVNDFLTFSGMPTGSIWTIFAVVRGQGSRYLSSGALFRLGWSGDQPNYYNGVTTIQGGPTGFGNSYRKVVTTTINNGPSTIRLNGIQVASGDPGSGVTATTWTIGGQSVGQFWDGEVVELIIYNSVLTVSEREAIEEYLMYKYGAIDSPASVQLPTHRFWHATEFALTAPSHEYTATIETSDGIEALDLLTGFDDDDKIVVTMPKYAGPITTTNSYIDFTDDSGSSVAIKFSDYFVSAPDYYNAVIADNPSLYWRLYETAGTNANDETTNNRDGTYGGGVTLNGASLVVSEPLGKSADLNSALVSSSYAAFTPGSTRTFAGVAHRDVAGGDSWQFFSSSLGGFYIDLSGDMDFINLRQANVTLASWNNLNPELITTANPFLWHLLVNDSASSSGGLAANTVELYINGVSRGQVATGTLNMPGGNFRLGGAEDFRTSWVGPMSNVAIYESILSPARILAQAQAAANGNATLRFPRSALNAIDLSSVTDVGLRVAATGPATLNLAGIRLFATDWEYSPLDIDTVSERLVSTVSPSGSLSELPSFELPRVWRSADPSSVDDPRPIDASIGVVFNSGQATGTNRFTIYFREVIEDYLTQLDLNGMTQTTLEGMHRQPDTGDGKWDPRNLSAFDGLTMADLEGDLMQDLERIADFDLSSWFGITFQWGLDRVIVTGDAEDNGISFEDISPLALDQRYLALFDVEETHFRVRLWPVTTGGVVQYSNLLYDTGHIEDDFLVKRRKGRIGWEIDLDDGAAYIEEIRTRYLNFAEYRSQPYESITPVEGARLFAEFPPDEELFTTLADGTNGGVVTTDTTRANSDQSYKIINTGSVANAGARSNVINFENFDDYQIEFEVWYPQWALDDDLDLKLYLIDDFGNKVALNFGNLSGDTWVHRSITPVEGNASLTGRYYLSWEQPDTGTPTEWWLDNIKVSRRSMRWEARAQLADPWDDVPALWTNFRDKINHQHDGIIFAERGKHLQVRGKALRQNVAMGQVQVVPKYAELGRATVGDQLMAANLAQGSAYDDNAEHISSLAGLDFGTAKRLDRVSIDFAIAPGFVKLSGSSDGVNYSTILTEEVTKVGWYTFVFNSKPTWRHLRWQKALGGFMNFYRVIVKPYPRNPTAAFTTSAAGFTISFDATTSTDPDGRIIAHAWNFGDGAQGNGQKAAHTYVAPGSYPVTLTVINEFGRAHQITTNVGV